MLTRASDCDNLDSTPTRGKANGVSRWPGVFIAFGLVLTLVWVILLSWIFLKIIHLL